MLSEDTRSVEEHSYDVEYTQMQIESMKTTCSLYSVSSGSLPSHFRSITPKPEVHFTIEHDACKQPPRCGTRTVYIILAAIFIVSSSVAIAVTVHEIREIQEESAALPVTHSLVPSYVHLNDTENDTTTLADLEAADRGTITTAYVESPSVVDPRTNCFKKCTMYGKPKFDSRCEAGFCVCRGNDFQKNTCLPSVDGCVIEKVPHSQTAFIWNSAATTYSCNIHANSRQTSDVYVVGIYGNHFSEATVVDIESDEDVRDAFIVVLASHYPVRWKLNHNNLPISEIILVSSNSLSSSQAEVVNQATPDTTTSPTVRNEYLPVGYGDDRYHSNTVEMLRNLTDIVGPITSFLGSSFADTIFLNISP